MNATAPPARLKSRYTDEIRPALIERFGYSSPMQAPKLEKITLNMGVGSAKQDSKALRAAQDQLATIAGQRPSVRRARKSIAAFKLREGMPVGVAVTLRGDRAYEFLDRLVSIAIPRIRDFRGLSARSFDGRGNYSLGVREQIIFPEIDYDAIDEVRGLDITITTSAASDPEAYALLASLGMPYTRQGMPGSLQELADDGLGPAAEGGPAGRRAESAAVSDEAPSSTSEASEPAAEPELSAGEAAETEVPVDEAEAELPVGEAAEAEPPVGGAGDEHVPEISDFAETSTSDGAQEPAGGEGAQGSSDGESTGSDGEESTGSDGEESTGSDGESAQARASGDATEDAAADDSNDTEDAD
jgi:large subunit ribosomal protein L5